MRAAMAVRISVEDGRLTASFGWAGGGLGGSAADFGRVGGLGGAGLAIALPFLSAAVSGRAPVGGGAGFGLGGLGFRRRERLPGRRQGR